LKLKCDEPLSNVAFNFNLRRYSEGKPGMDTEGWWDIADGFAEDFNLNRQYTFGGSGTIVYDELMSPWRPRTTALGGLPNLSFVMRKPEPLGTEMKCACDAEVGLMLYLEFQKGTDAMRAAPHAKDVGVCGACAIRLGRGSARRVETAEAAELGASTARAACDVYDVRDGQGLTLVHFSAQPELLLTQNTACTPPHSPKHPPNSPQTPLK
jgi:hypothetical protein